MSEMESGSAVRRAGRRRPMAQPGGGGSNERVRSYRHPVNPFEPIRIYSEVRLGVKPEINAICTIMIAVVAVGVIAASLLSKLRETKPAMPVPGTV